MLNQEMIERLAKGDEAARAEVDNLPPVLKMSYGFAADEYARKNNVEKVDNGTSLYIQKKQKSVSNEDIAISLSKHLEEKRIKEEILEKQRQEHAEKVAKQQVARARALGSYQ